MTEDEELVEQVLHGNIQAYSQLVDKYKNRVYSLLLRMINQPQDAQDLAQEVFIKIFYQLRDYRPEGRFSAWLYRIAANHCLDTLRKRKQISYLQLETDELASYETPETAILQQERVEMLHELVMTLSEKYRAVLLLRHMEGMSYSEISEVLNIPQSVVQVRLYRARKALRGKLMHNSRGGELHEVLEL